MPRFLLVKKVASKKAESCCQKYQKTGEEIKKNLLFLSNLYKSVVDLNKRNCRIQEMFTKFQTPP